MLQIFAKIKVYTWEYNEKKEIITIIEITTSAMIQDTTLKNGRNMIVFHNECNVQWFLDNLLNWN